MGVVSMTDAKASVLAGIHLEQPDGPGGKRPAGIARIA